MENFIFYALYEYSILRIIYKRLLLTLVFANALLHHKALLGSLMQSLISSNDQRYFYDKLISSMFDSFN